MIKNYLSRMINSFLCLKTVTCIFLIMYAFQINAQLSDLHYLPPLKMAVDNGIFDDQALYLSTPEKIAFEVEIYQGTITTPIATVTISNDFPAVYNLVGGVNDIMMISEINSGVVLNQSGLRLQSVNNESFYVSFRGNSSSQGESLTSKGRTALGTNFKWGSIPTVDTSNNNNNHNATLGIMATQDNTTIIISDYNSNCTFRLGTAIAGITDDEIMVLLNENETYVLEAPMSGNPNNNAGTIGSDIISDKPIVISSGNIMVGLQQGANTQDVGIDQSVPIEKIGREYIFIRGNGTDAMEFPVIIAVQNNTNVFINGASNPSATLNEGEFYVVDGSNYGIDDNAGDNIFVQTSANVYAYQCTAGDDAFPTLGMNFISPISCLMPREVNNIPFINQLPTTRINGGVTLLASTNTPDENIIIIDDNGLVALTESNPVSGTVDWKTFYLSGLVGNVSVESSGPISVGFVGFNNNIGSASYFSGFDNVPFVDFSFGSVDDPGCLGDTITLIDVFDSYQWYQDGLAIEDAIEQTFTPIQIGNVYVEVTSGTKDGNACSFLSNGIEVYYCEPEIVVDKTADVSTARINDTINYTITVQSLGVDDVTNLNILDELPSELTLVSAEPTKGSWISPNWNIGTMTAGETQTIIITTTVTSEPSGNTNVVTNTAVNTQDQIDNNIEQDFPSVSIIIGADYDNDGIDNTVDEDDDNDGILDIDETNGDFDNDGIVNQFDLDSDNDGIFDIIEAGGIDTNNDGRVDYPIAGEPSSMLDDNSNGVDDTIEVTPLSDPDSDNDSLADRIDLDSDDDGLTDNVEAQTTFEYISPNNVFDFNGIDRSYTTGISPIDTDTDNTPDYLDIDSDNDEISDTMETSIGTFLGADSDNDGLDDGFEGSEINDPTDVNDEIDDPITLPDTQNPGGDVDFRDNSEFGEENNDNDDDDDDDVFIDNESVGPNIDEGFLRINNIELYPNNNLKIFNRWGVIVFETSNYINGSNDFRGISNGRVTIRNKSTLPAGIYFYILEYTKENVQQSKKGYLYVVK